MIRRLAFGLLLALAGCNRGGVADVTLDADASQRNATAAKTLADLDAATSASRGPAPVVRDAEPANVQSGADKAARDEREAAKPAQPGGESGNETASVVNETAPSDAETR